METLLAIAVACFFATSIYLMLSGSLVRILIGIVVFSNGVNLLIFTAGRLTAATPPIIGAGAAGTTGEFANPLPQALILTAIVISFSIFAFLLILTFRAYQDLGTDEIDEMRVAEPPGAPRPPMDY